jgi:hypothetical protein
MKVIGAGFMRTGTMSMQAALQLLGYPCYHMQEVLREPGHLEKWSDFVTGKDSMDWHSLFHNFEATVDTPACVYYRELMLAFPDAKVILTLRDPERWYQSFVTLRKTHDSLRPLSRWIPRLKKALHAADVLWNNMFNGCFERENCIRIFNEHNAAVQKFVPPERLLVFQVNEGWQPLCGFLDCEIPAGISFPHLNEGDKTLKATAWQVFIFPWLRNAIFAITAIVLLLLLL